MMTRSHTTEVHAFQASSHCLLENKIEELRERNTKTNILFTRLLFVTCCLSKHAQHFASCPLRVVMSHHLVAGGQTKSIHDITDNVKYTTFYTRFKLMAAKQV